MSEIVRARDLRKTFHGSGSRAHSIEAVRGISFSIEEGHSLGLVGESGSGKTTIARVVCGLERPTSGEVTVVGFDLHRMKGHTPREFYSRVQMVFQDPFLSLSPRMRVAEAIGYSLRIHGVPRAERERRVREAVGRVGLPAAVLDHFPHQLSTGQRQRVGIARAVIAEPTLIVADEPVSSLDVSLQTQILNLLAEIQEQSRISYLFISHDLAVVGYLCDRVLVMQRGEEVEQGEAARVLTAPEEAYTRLLVDAAGIG